MFVKLCTLALLGRNEQLPHDKGMIFFLYRQVLFTKITQNCHKIAN